MKLLLFLRRLLSILLRKRLLLEDSSDHLLPRHHQGQLATAQSNVLPKKRWEKPSFSSSSPRASAPSSSSSSSSSSSGSSASASPSSALCVSKFVSEDHFIAEKNIHLLNVWEQGQRTNVNYFHFNHLDHQHQLQLNHYHRDDADDADQDTDLSLAQATELLRVVTARSQELNLPLVVAILDR